MDFNEKVDILVLGNGFDLYHGLNTRYSDFIHYIKWKDKELDDPHMVKPIKKFLDHNLLKEHLIARLDLEKWIDLEIELGKLVVFFSKVLPVIEKNGQSALASDFSFTYQEEMFLCNLNSFITSEYRDNQMYYVINKCGKELANQLRKDLDGLIQALKYYLKLETMDMELINLSGQIKNINPDYVINFNYTDTILSYGVAPKDIFYIHGNLKSDPCNMVLGIDSDEEDEDLTFVYFKKYFQRIQKRTGHFDTNKILSNIGKPPYSEITVHIFGHSLGYSDRDIIKQLLECRKVVIYFLDQRDYEEKVINLIRIIGKDETIKAIGEKHILFTKIE